MNILGLDTSTEACSVALLKSSGDIFSEFEITPRQHTRYLPQMLESVLHKAAVNRDQISHICFANGPGAFTGVRIAAATAQGLAIGLNLPLVGISSLAVLAQQAVESTGEVQVLAALDARMGEAYMALYQKSETTATVQLSGEESLQKLVDIHLRPDVLSAGSGFKAWREAGFTDAGNSNIQEDIFPTASALVRLARQAIDSGNTSSADQVAVNYIRNKVAEKKKAI